MIYMRVLKAADEVVALSRTSWLAPASARKQLPNSLRKSATTERQIATMRRTQIDLRDRSQICGRQMIASSFIGRLGEKFLAIARYVE
jgi:hypothetical protein